jgi:diguanylate cyclase (GGDEF)-like protein
LFRKRIPSILLISFLIYSFLFVVVDAVTVHAFIGSGCFFLFVFFYFSLKKKYVDQYFLSKKEEAQEKLNILEGELKKKSKILRELAPRTKRIFSIKDIANRLVALIDVKEFCDQLVDELGKVFQDADNVLIYSLSKKRSSLSLSSSLRRSHQRIKEKSGDDIDQWILRNNKSILIKDLGSDYRFDADKLLAYKKRDIASVISSPISIGPKIIGLVRLESINSNAFSLEDSRVLRASCDLAAVILERNHLFARIRELAIKDSLTNLYLKNYFFERVAEEIKRSSINKKSFGIGMFDIDNFKKINDRYGHAVGDLALKKLAKIIKKNTTSAGNIAARFGGEEFVFLIVETDEDSLFSVAEGIRTEVASNRINFRRKSIKMTVSGGLAFYPRDGGDCSQLMQVTDKRLYQAKKQGKNKVCFL